MSVYYPYRAAEFEASPPRTPRVITQEGSHFSHSSGGASDISSAVLPTIMSPSFRTFKLCVHTGNPTSYFERLPVELMVETFTYCLAPYPSFNQHEAPLLLCRVCSSWRTIVQSTPKLWACFQIVIPELDIVDLMRNQCRMNTMSLWLERSRNNTLSIQIVHNLSGRIPDQRSAQLLSILSFHAHRWRDIHFRIPCSSVQPLQEVAFPALRSMTLDIRGLQSSTVSLDVRDLGIPWDKLTGLNLHLDNNQLLTLDKCFDILTRSANLSRCTLNTDCIFDTLIGYPGQVTLPVLNHLHLFLQHGEQVYSNGVRVTETAESCLVSFLELLDLPELKTLHLEWLVQWDGGDEHWFEIHSRFIVVLTHLTLTLRSLSLAYLPLTEVELLDCLSQLPNLTHLDLRFSLADREHDPISDGFLRACTLRHEKSPLGFLHFLENIHLQCHGAHCTSALLIDLIQSRWEPATKKANMRLKSFRFISTKPVAIDIRKKLCSWLEAGLDASIEDVVVR